MSNVQIDSSTLESVKKRNLDRIQNSFGEDSIQV
jgi:hypothetical protein